MESGINVEKNIGIHLENKEVSRKFLWFIFITYVLVCMTKNCYNAAMSVSYMLAAYVMPKTVEVFSWGTYLTSLPILIGISAVSLLVVCKTFKNFKRAQL